jgi:protein transport protein SEC13
MCSSRSCWGEWVVLVFVVVAMHAPPPFMRCECRHSGPVWQVAWAHPKFGTVLASCGYDRQAIVWQEAPPGTWTEVTSIKAETSINSVCWAPHELGLVLACATSDGHVIIAKKQADDSWYTEAQLEDCPEGTLAVSWAPTGHLGSSVGGDAVMRLVTAGCDFKVRVWSKQGGGTWKSSEADILSGHSRWVRDVAWAPATGLPVNQIASCSEDGKVLVWEQSTPGGLWTSRLVRDFGAPVWSVSWSLTGGVLAVSSGDPSGEAAVTLFKQSLLGDWTEIEDPASAALGPDTAKEGQ